MGRMQLKLKNWPFDKGVKAQLIWIGEPFKIQNKWMINTYFNDGKDTKKVLQDWANIHFLSIEKYYIDGDLNSGKIIDNDNKTKIMDIDLGGIMPKYNENDWRIKGTDFRSKSRTYNFYKNNKLYTIPIIEIVRSLLAPNTFMLNNILYTNIFEDYFTYDIADDVLKLYFNGNYKSSNLKANYLNHLAWIISNRNVLSMVESIGYNASCKHKMMFDFNMKHFKFTARVKENKAGYTILEIIKLKEKRINFNEIQVFHPSFEQYQKSDGSKKWTYTNVNRNKGDKRVVDNELDGANKMTESIENDFIMHEYVKSPQIHRIKTGHANKHMIVDTKTKIYFKNDDNNRTFADQGGFNTGTGIDAANMDLQYRNLSEELKEFIELLNLLAKQQKIVDMKILIGDFQKEISGKAFLKLSDGTTNRRYIIAKIEMYDGKRVSVIEIERDEKSISTLVLIANTNVNWNRIYTKLFEGVVSAGGTWEGELLELVKKMGVEVRKNKHIRKNNRYKNMMNIYKNII